MKTHDNRYLTIIKSYSLILSFVINVALFLFLLFGEPSSNVRFVVDHVMTYSSPQYRQQQQHKTHHHQSQHQSQQQSQQQQQYYEIRQEHQQQLTQQQQQRRLEDITSSNNNSFSNDTTVLFGTSNGYDSGGSSSMCWSTMMLSNQEYTFMKSNVTNNNTTDYTSSSLDKMMPILLPNATIDAVTDRMFDLASSLSSSSSSSLGETKDLLDTRLLSTCFNGTTMKVTPLGMPFPPRQMLTEVDYTFEVTIRIDISKIIDNLNASTEIQLPIDNRNWTVCYVRLMLCNAIETGFCNPLRSTRSIERNLSINQTDWLQPSNNNTNQSLLSNNNKYSYEENDILLGILDGPYIFTRWILWSLIPESPNSTIYKSSVNFTIRLPKGTSRGAYFFIGHSSISLYKNNSDTIQRIDIAAALPDNVVGVSDPPTILYVTKAMTIILGITIGIFGSISVIIILYILYHRNHTVMRLAQGKFLAAIAFACLFQIVFTFAILPTKQIYCLLKDFFYLIPQTIIAAILVARMWRSYSILHKAQKIGGNGGLHIMNNNSKWMNKTALFEQVFVNTLTFIADPISSLLPTSVSKRDSLLVQQGGGNIRSQIHYRYSITLIVLLSLPQFIVQIYTTCFYSIQLNIMYNDDETVGRYVCDMGNNFWAGPFGMAYCAFIFILAVIMAYISRALPSIFNEKDEVFHVASINALLAVIGLSLISMMDEPTTQPDVMVTLKVGLNIGSAVAVLKIMIYPKLLRVYRGEKVVMGAVFHSKFTLDNSKSLSASTTKQHSEHYDGTSPHNIDGGNTHNVPVGQKQYPSTVADSCTTIKTGHVAIPDDHNNISNMEQSSSLPPSTTTTTTILSETAPAQSITIHHQDSNGIELRKITIREGDPLPSKVERQIHQLQLLLRDLSNQMCDGRAISTDEFLMLKEHVAKLQSHLIHIDMEGVEPSNDRFDV